MSKRTVSGLGGAAIRRIHVPLRVPTDIIPYLGAPHHWKEGRSAKCLIDQWWNANGLPRSIQSLLDNAEEWRGAELIDAYAERQTSLKDGRPSHPQSDLLAIVGVEDRLGVIAVEAKVDEGFDKTVDEWRRVDSAGKAVRLAGLCSRLGLDPSGVGRFRYQLFHRTAAALIEAHRYRSRQAAMIVQSWCPIRSSYEDYRNFCGFVGFEDLGPNQLSEPRAFNGVQLRVGWSTEKGA
ncbi:MAG TPA: hypothetical protein VFY95_09795 [Sphingomicrobium sp.]